MKSVIYTAISGEYDKLQNPGIIEKDIDYICFTDNKKIKSDIWEIRSLPDSIKYLDANRRAKYPKILPHKLLSEYDVSMWIDGNMKIIRPLYTLMRLNIEKFNIAFFKHPNNRRSLLDEINACLVLNKDNDEYLLTQYNYYSKINGLMNLKFLYPCCGFILRRHNNVYIKKIMESWWEQIINFSKRDQISFAYILNQYKFEYNIMGKHLNYFKKIKHNGS